MSQVSCLYSHEIDSGRANLSPTIVIVISSIVEDVRTVASNLDYPKILEAVFGDTINGID